MTNLRRRARLATIALLTLLVLSSLFALDESALAQRTRVGVLQSFIGNVAPIGFWVADDLGLFEKYDLDVELTISAGMASPQVVSAISGGGGARIAFVGPTSVLSAAARGVPLIVFATLAPGMPYIVIGAPDINSIADLRGKVVGTASPGFDLSRTSLHLALRHAGLDPHRDVTFFPTGGQTSRVAAVATGQTAATVVGVEQRARAESLGLKVLADLSQMNIPWDHEVLATTRSYLEANRDVLVRLMKAIIEANAYVRDPANRAHVMRLIMKHLEYDSEEDAEIAYQLAVNRWAVLDPTPSVEALENMAELASVLDPEFKSVDVKSVVDLSVVTALKESGFIDSVAAR